MTRARKHVAAMAPYALADLSGPDGHPAPSLAQNESFRPPCPGAFEAVVAAMADAALYPDPEWTALRSTIATRHGLDPDSILCGSGSLELISCLARAFAGPHRAVLAPEHAYPYFRSAAQASEARFDTAPESGCTASADALLEAVRPDTGCVFLANPGNPTGTRIPTGEIRRLRGSLREDILLVVDEAYGEFADHLDAPVFDMAATGNTVILRTFSKAYGLAGCRVGWGTFPAGIAVEVRKVLNPSNVTAISQAAARAALQDDAYMRETCAMTAERRDQAAAKLAALGMRCLSGSTNFLLLDLETQERARSAEARLRSGRAVVRAQGAAGLPHCLRMTIGPARELDNAISLLETWIREDTP
ncbi:MAG: histidinol-phosphate transaminase [Boseongicola sp.]|nr:histidinol-phosphate transaminase [Boseongicola sp.]MDE0347799.1 histidinol-phosphate transaminase [Boseongicola sp.]MXW86823.1 aminotransferase class I/II-fold pyridoxal phosphate-dependent enzyme [Boseongicola sp. SB0667_bin_21]